MKWLLTIVVMFLGVFFLNGSAVYAQTTILREFAGGASDGAFGSTSEPFDADLTHVNGKLYGMTEFGGDSNRGTVFSINTDGTGFTLLREFAGGTSDGHAPHGSLTISGTTMYGMTNAGGTYDEGIIFTMQTDGSGFSVLHSFQDVDTNGALPYGGLLLDGSKLYGMTYAGGDFASGTVFSINTNGTGFTLLNEFDSHSPFGSLVISGSTLYGMTNTGGTLGRGIIFSIGTDGSGYTVIKNFGSASTNGRFPYGTLLQSGSTLYGLASGGGSGSCGTAFSTSTSGTPFTVLHSFTGSTTDGCSPYSDLILSGTTLYGISIEGGTSNFGTIYSLETDGSGYEVLHSFAGGTSDGREPWGSLILVGSKLYGMTKLGGDNAKGVIYSFSLDSTAPTNSNVAATTSGSNVTITWNTDEAGSSIVEYGTSTSYGTTTTETDTSPRTTSHSVTLTGLTSCTVYHYRVKSTDENSNTATSSDYAFTSEGCTAPASAEETIQISGGSATDGGGGVLEPIKDSSTGAQDVTVIIQPQTIEFDAFLSSISIIPKVLYASATNLPVTNQLGVGSSSLAGNVTFAGGNGGLLGIKSNSGVAWQVGNIQQIWYKTYPPKGTDVAPAKIMPELQSKPSIISLSFTDADLVPPGQPTAKFNSKNLKLAFSTDGLNWRILPSSVVDTVNKTVAAIDKVGGYYMIVASTGSSVPSTRLATSQVRGESTTKVPPKQIKPTPLPTVVKPITTSTNSTSPSIIDKITDKIFFWQ